MRIDLIAFVAGLGIVSSAAQVSAHHAFAAEFDVSRPITLEGTVVELELINPHSWIHLDVTRPDGVVERWMIEGGPPNALFRRGFTRAKMRPIESPNRAGMCLFDDCRLLPLCGSAGVGVWLDLIVNQNLLGAGAKRHSVPEVIKRHVVDVIGASCYGKFDRTRLLHHT